MVAGDGLIEYLHDKGANDDTDSRRSANDVQDVDALGGGNLPTRLVSLEIKLPFQTPQMRS